MVKKFLPLTYALILSFASTAYANSITYATGPAKTSTSNTAATKSSTASFVQTSPAWLSHVSGPANMPKGLPREEDIKAGPIIPGSFKLDMTKYPEPLKQPPINHPEVQAVIKQLDFAKIPKAPTRKRKEWSPDLTGYDVNKDPDCWWTATICKKPKVSYVPEDIYICPNKGDWGLNYDDGPYKKWWPTSEKDKEHDQPRFYNYLIANGKQKATLFFVGSNVVYYPEAAQRALSDGHTLCSHTWSHPLMTTLTNEEIVAQLYWTQRAIKETTGVTPKCWRPPYGDVDDRVRAIAWQMGMRTFLWDQDTYDWNLANGGIQLSQIDQSFEKWIRDRLAGNDTEHGHITLQHENNNLTIEISEKWLPKLQKTHRVMPIHQCINDASPYWEQSWVYPTLDNPNPPRYSLNTRPIFKASAMRSVVTNVLPYLFILITGFLFLH
ncbi:hypothetical protein BDF20DRAFT_995716 [Mycotypha africana]|uniref:uncharacterized protein n=1 Tax=Mycotypha africana TaxID=64632 RepID=UPI002300FB10|nr:uncharacterized protein BDF20DRAFT_995716 [Mycotypha africana]KAI8971940.1 hypothetical protein BDF20DRAFT_995716 [Mycotypha africana]